MGRLLLNVATATACAARSIFRVQIDKTAEAAALAGRAAAAIEERTYDSKQVALSALCSTHTCNHRMEYE